MFGDTTAVELSSRHDELEQISQVIRDCQSAVLMKKKSVLLSNVPQSTAEWMDVLATMTPDKLAELLAATRNASH